MLLPNGKVNLRALAGGSVLGDVVQRTGGTVAGDATTTDSLGVVRALSAGAVATARETQAEAFGNDYDKYFSQKACTAY